MKALHIEVAPIFDIVTDYIKSLNIVNSNTLDANDKALLQVLDNPMLYFTNQHLINEISDEASEEIVDKISKFILSDKTNLIKCITELLQKDVWESYIILDSTQEYIYNYSMYDLTHTSTIYMIIQKIKSLSVIVKIDDKYCNGEMYISAIFKDLLEVTRIE